jgi:hypothetical protein
MAGPAKRADTLKITALTSAHPAWLIRSIDSRAFMVYNNRRLTA